MTETDKIKGEVLGMNFKEWVLVVMILASMVALFVVGYRQGYIDSYNSAVNIVGDNCMNVCNVKYGCQGCRITREAIFENMIMPDFMNTTK